MAEAPFDLSKAHRWFGIDLNNSTMDALDAGLVTPETAEPYIHAAHASCYHWMQVGTVANHGRGEFAVASVYAAAGLGEAALRHARRYLELAQASPDRWPTGTLPSPMMPWPAPTPPPGRRTRRAGQEIRRRLPLMPLPMRKIEMSF